MRKLTICNKRKVVTLPKRTEMLVTQLVIKILFFKPPTRSVHIELTGCNKNSTLMKNFIWSFCHIRSHTWWRGGGGGGGGGGKWGVEGGSKT